MRTVFHLTREEYSEIKSTGLTLHVGGQIFTMIVDGKRSQLEDEKKAKPQPTYSEKQKREILAYAAKHSLTEAAEKFGVSKGGITYWLSKGGKK